STASRHRVTGGRILRNRWPDVIGMGGRMRRNAHLRRYRIAKHLATAVAIMGLSIFLALRLDDLETDKTGAYAIIYAAALGTLGWAFTLYET
ncbi:hypothetical protein, partial [Roseovarius sp. SYSU LYC5161]|uniref:hypothetical protein n=1 Tax=Roseovarius halophilus (ex Wu et al. 2025) TaxID=3376060 RepID=UPI00399BC2C1